MCFLWCFPVFTELILPFLVGVSMMFPNLPGIESFSYLGLIILVWVLPVFLALAVKNNEWLKENQKKKWIPIELYLLIIGFFIWLFTFAGMGFYLGNKPRMSLQGVLYRLKDAGLHEVVLRSLKSTQEKSFEILCNESIDIKKYLPLVDAADLEVEGLLSLGGLRKPKVYKLVLTDDARVFQYVSLPSGRDKNVVGNWNAKDRIMLVDLKQGDWYQTLCHEMVHAWISEYAAKRTFLTGYYQNDFWLNEGLCDYVGAYLSGKRAAAQGKLEFTDAVFYKRYMIGKFNNIKKFIPFEFFAYSTRYDFGRDKYTYGGLFTAACIQGVGWVDYLKFAFGVFSGESYEKSFEKIRPGKSFRQYLVLLGNAVRGPDQKIPGGGEGIARNQEDPWEIVNKKFDQFIDSPTADKIGPFLIVLFPLLCAAARIFGRKGLVGLESGIEAPADSPLWPLAVIYKMELFVEWPLTFLVSRSLGKIPFIARLMAFSTQVVGVAVVAFGMILNFVFVSSAFYIVFY